MSSSPSGYCAFVRFVDDGATAKIVTPADILGRDESPVQRLLDLKCGQDILAKWSNGRFYNATVEYVGPTDEKKPKVKKTPKETFLGTLLSSANNEDTAKSASSGSDTLVIERSPLSEHGEPSPIMGRSTPGPLPNDPKGNGAEGTSPLSPNGAKGAAAPWPNGAEVAPAPPPSSNMGKGATPSSNRVGPSPDWGNVPARTSLDMGNSTPLPWGTVGPSAYGYWFVTISTSW